MIRLPGLIDPHVHLRDPGETDKEDFYTGTAAALAGGYTTVIDMPNNVKPITTVTALEEKIAIAKQKIVCDIGFYFGSMGDNLDEFEKLQDNVTLSETKGLDSSAPPQNDRLRVFGLKLYMNHTTGDYLLDHKHLEQIFNAWPNTSPILFHAENETFDLVLRILKNSPRPIHLCHISSKHELATVIKAKEQNLPVTCGVTPHHLFLAENDLNHLSNFGLMKPPLQSREDVDFLWDNLKAIDVVESDHAPHTLAEKQSNKPFYGVTGLETTLPLLLTAVHEGKLTTEDIVRLCHDGPKEVFHLPNLPDLPNHPTFVEIDPDTEWVITNEDLQTKSKWSPFAGWKVKGRVRSVTLRGKKVFEDGKILAEPSSGHILSP